MNVDNLNLKNILKTQIEYLKNHDTKAEISSKTVGDLYLKEQHGRSAIFAISYRSDAAHIDTLMNEFKVNTIVSLFKNGRHELTGSHTVVAVDDMTVTLSLDGTVRKSKKKEFFTVDPRDHPEIPYEHEEEMCDRYRMKKRPIGTRLQAVSKFLEYLQENLDNDVIRGSSVLKTLFDAKNLVEVKRVDNKETVILPRAVKEKSPLEHFDDMVNQLGAFWGGALCIDDDLSIGNEYGTVVNLNLTEDQAKVVKHLSKCIAGKDNFKIVSSVPGRDNPVALGFIADQVLNGKRILVTAHGGLSKMIDQLKKLEYDHPSMQIRAAYISTREDDRSIITCQFTQIWVMSCRRVGPPKKIIVKNVEFTGKAPDEMKILSHCHIIFANPLDLNFKDPELEWLQNKRLYDDIFKRRDLTVCMSAHEMTDGVAMMITSLTPKTVYFLNSQSWPIPNIRHPDVSTYHMSTDLPFSMLQFAADHYVTNETILRGKQCTKGNNTRPDLRLKALTEFVKEAYPELDAAGDADESVNA